jgi:hypothetical protein
MNIINLGSPCLFNFIFFIFACNICSDNHTKSMTKQEMIMENQFTYNSFFESPKRDCSISTVANGKGAIIWSSELYGPVSDINKLLIWEGNIVVTTYSEIYVFKNDGKRLWERKKQDGSDVSLGNGLAYYENEDNKLDAVNTYNQLILDNAYFPGAMNREFHVELIWPMENEFISAVYWQGRIPDGMGYETGWRRTIYGKMLASFGKDYDGFSLLPPVFIPELEHLLISVNYDIIYINTKNGEEIKRFKLPDKNPIDWSADSESLVFLFGNDDLYKLMVCTSLEGEEKWRWEDTSKLVGWIKKQPPVRWGSKRVYALTDRSILAIEEGKLIWSYDEFIAAPRNASSLSDGSVLITAGKTLTLLNSLGKLIFDVSLEEDILSPPIVDAEGNIYVATDKKLYKIN